MSITRYSVFLFVFVLASSNASGEWRQYASCRDGAGSFITNNAYRQLTASAQSGGTGISSGGPWTHYAGFVNTFSMFTDRDADGDGLADEVDADNDGDGLADTVELNGSAFLPVTSTDLNTADSDGDGVDDGREAGAGTDPLDTNVYLHITAIERSNGAMRIRWMARSMKSYNVVHEDQRDWTMPTRVLTNITVTAPGAGVWQVATGCFDHVTSTNFEIYGIELDM